MTSANGGPIEEAASVDVALSSLSDAELEEIVRHGIEQGELAIEGQLLDVPAVDSLESNGDGCLRIAGPEADERVDST